MQSLAVTALADWVAEQAAAGTPALLLDVREPWETALGVIELPQAQTLTWPMQTIPDRLDDLDRSQPIVCICHHGMRSAQVVAFLERQGHDLVYNLAGGTHAWSSEVDARLPIY